MGFFDLFLKTGKHLDLLIKYPTHLGALFYPPTF